MTTNGLKVSSTRLMVLAAAFVATAVVVETAQMQRRVPERPPLRSFPLQIEDWSGRVFPDFDERVVRVLGADEYLTRVYQQGEGPPVDLFVGYYGSQTTGAVIHSPLNCLPGAGWVFSIESASASRFPQDSPRGPAPTARSSSTGS